MSCRMRRNAKNTHSILVPRGRAPFGQHQESPPLAKSNTESPRFTDFSSLCACSVSSLTNLIGSDLNLLCLQSHSKTECRWTRPEVAILGADQKKRGLWGRECNHSMATELKTDCACVTYHPVGGSLAGKSRLEQQISNVKSITER